MNKKIEHTINGIHYEEPTVILLQDTGIGTAELAARTAYDSFDNSENQCVKDFNDISDKAESDSEILQNTISNVNEIYESDLLDNLAWTYFHHSVLEHASLTYMIQGTSRGVLQELARHRIASYTVRSTRYTMGSVLNAFNASIKSGSSKSWFCEKLATLDLLVISDEYYNDLEFGAIWEKLMYQLLKIGKDKFIKISVAKTSLEFIYDDIINAEDTFNELESGKAKRNVGDPFKHIVSDNWKVDLVMTMNLRSLRNFFELRDSGAAWFQIQWLAKAIKKATPTKYLKLIVKQKIT